MQTRVGRHNYQEEVLDVGGRTKKNADLYKKDYKDEKIKVPKISNGRELDEEEFQKIINQSKTRSMKTITKEEIEEPITKNEDKIYDINSVLEKAKNRRKSASKTQYKVPAFEEYIPVEEQEIKDDMELLSDLMGDGNTVVTPRLVDDTIIEEDLTETQTQIDDSFYSKSIKFERKDFDDNKFHEKTKKHSRLQVAVTIIVVILLIIAVILGILILSKFKF